MEAEFYDYEKNEKWKKIFMNMHSMSKTFSNKESKRPENRPLNRYTDVVPYDETRVKLERFSLNYINASHVCVPSANRKYILTQGPLYNTSGHFWLMVWEQNSKAILMLNNLMECGNIKCHKYWPDGKSNNDKDELIFDDVKLKVELLSYEKFDFYILRKFKLFDFLSDTSREIFHFHYTHWPDFDLPKSCGSFLDFLSEVRKSECLNSDLFGSPVIHCSAGIGRSGTFVLVDSCLVMIEKNKCRNSINVIDVLLDLRNYRMGLIQTSDQLRFSFLAIIEGSKSISEETPAQNNNNITTKIQRSFGLNEEDEEIENEEEIIFDQSNLKEVSNESNICSSNSDTNIRLRKKEREEKRQQTLDTINRIKRKQKEVEERLKFNRKFYKYLKTSLCCLGVAICIGLFVFVKKGDSIIINYD